MPVVTLPDLKLNYVRLRAEVAESDVPTILVHGLAASLAFWYPAAQLLAKSGRDVILYDLRGHGRSFCPEGGYTPTQMAADLESLMSALDIATAHIVGHSFGGSVALAFARAHPARVKSLTLADVRLRACQPQLPVGSWPNWPALQPALAAAGITIAEDETEAGYRFLTEMARLQLAPPEQQPQLDASLSPLLPPIGSKHAARRWLKLYENPQARQELQQGDGLDPAALTPLQLPTLAMYGDRSPALPTAEALRSLWPHARFEFVPGGGHFFPISKPAQFAERWLQSQQFWQQHER